MTSSTACDQQKAAVQSGYWPLMRYNPALRDGGQEPLATGRGTTIPLKDYAYQEARYTMLARSQPDAAKELLHKDQDDVERQWRSFYSARAAMPGRGETPHIAPSEREEAVAMSASGKTTED